MRYACVENTTLRSCLLSTPVQHACETTGLRFAAKVPRPLGHATKLVTIM